MHDVAHVIAHPLVYRFLEINHLLGTVGCPEVKIDISKTPLLRTKSITLKIFRKFQQFLIIYFDSLDNSAYFKPKKLGTQGWRVCTVAFRSESAEHRNSKISKKTPQYVCHSIELIKLSNFCEDTIWLSIMVCMVQQFEWV